MEESVKNSRMYPPRGDFFNNRIPDANAIVTRKHNRNFLFHNLSMKSFIFPKFLFNTIYITKYIIIQIPNSIIDFIGNPGSFDIDV